ncbi:hypothetical protein B296_00051030 [Ensete ventricosum]|uniref:Uncharacterized protein n=1 Tax=Ensete ventricosum TaxID=4639 RepID=A0A426X863_ENSVE|nr:hypothetical protein B296_00051030 [Ensete ventricosum]
MVCTIPASAWTWLVRPRNASAVTMSGAGFDAGEGNPGSVIILRKRLGVGTTAATSSVGRGWCRSFYNGCCRLFVPDDLTAFMAYHAAVPSIMLTVLAMRRAFAGGGCRPYLCQVGYTTTGAPRISGRLPALGRSRQRASCPRV